MSRLTMRERELLFSLGFSEDDVFDGYDITSGTERREQAKKLKKNIVLRDPFRADCDHRLTTRAGHCIVCNPANLGYQERLSAYGYVYVAGSKSISMLKVGFSTDPSVRIDKINYDAVASASDWEILFKVLTKDGGRVEQEAQRFLSHYAVPVSYLKDGKTQVSREVFKCSFSEAISAIAKAMQQNSLRPAEPVWRSQRYKLYETP